MNLGDPVVRGWASSTVATDKLPDRRTGSVIQASTYRYNECVWLTVMGVANGNPDLRKLKMAIRENCARKFNSLVNYGAPEHLLHLTHVQCTDRKVILQHSGRACTCSVHG